MGIFLILEYSFDIPLSLTHFPWKVEDTKNLYTFK